MAQGSSFTIHPQGKFICVRSEFSGGIRVVEGVLKGDVSNEIGHLREAANRRRGRVLKQPKIEFQAPARPASSAWHALQVHSCIMLRSMALTLPHNRNRNLSPSPGIIPKFPRISPSREEPPMTLMAIASRRCFGCGGILHHDLPGCAFARCPQYFTHSYQQLPQASNTSSEIPSLNRPSGSRTIGTVDATDMGGRESERTLHR